jgi:type I restriction enzyme S subunit
MELFLLSEVATIAINGMKTGSSESGLNLTHDRFRKLTVPIPPLAEQHRIVTKVEELMALCDHLEAAQRDREAQRDALRSVSLYHLTGIDQGEVTKAEVQFFLDTLPRLMTKPVHLTELRQAIFNLGVKGMLLPQNCGTSPSDSASTEVAGVAGPFDLPPRWHWSTVAQLGSARLGKMLDRAKNRGTPRRYLRNVNVRWFDFDLSALNLMPFEDRELDEFALRPGDVLICEGGEAGRAAVWDGREDDIYFQKALHRVRLHEELLPEFFVYYLRASADAGRLASYSTGATFMHLTGQLLASLPIPVPPKEEQQRIVHKIDELTSLCDELECALALEENECAKLLESLLHEALNGNSEPLPLAETELAEHSAK